MNSVSFDIMQFLEANAFGVAGTDLFSFEWGMSSGSEVDRQILVLDQEALDSPMKEQYEQPIFQILVRGEKSESGRLVYDRARAIFEFMIAQPTQAINGEDYLQFEPIGNVVQLGRDDNDRYNVSMNFYTFRNPA